MGFSNFLIVPLLVFYFSAWLFYFLKKDRLATGLIILSFFLTGLSLYSFAYSEYHKNPLQKLPAEGYLDFKGKLLRLPERRPDRDILTIKVTEVEVQGKREKITGNLRLSVPHSTSEHPLELLAGDRLEFSATLVPEQSFRNLFPDFMPRYLLSQKIQARAFSKSPLLVRKINEKNYSLPGFFSSLRRSLQKTIEKDFPGKDNFSLSPEGAILEALLLGEDGRLDPNTDLQFQKTGLYHLLAISGAHVAVVSFLIYSLLGLFIIRKRTIHLILLIALIFYGFLVEGQPSVFRAAIMTSVFLLGKLVYADTNLINTLSLSALILLFLNPFSLEDVGFQLTFLATMSLILFSRPLIKAFPRLPFRLSEMAALSVAAVAGTMPVIVSNFNRVTFASLILNLPAVPLMGIIMGMGYIYLILNSFLAAAGHLLSLALNLLVKLFVWMTTWLEPFSSLSYRIPNPPLVVVLGFYLFLLFFLLKSRFRGQKLLTAAGFLCFFFLLITYPFSPKNADLRVTFMDVGQGEAIIVEFPQSRLMVIDAGGFIQSPFDPGESLVSPYLWHRGYKKIDYLISTHLHPDHAGGLPALARNFRIKEYWFTEENPEWLLDREIRKSLPAKAKKIRMRTGQEITCSGARIEVIYPDELAFSRFKSANEVSAVLRIEFNQFSFLFPADITTPVEDYLLSVSPGKLKSTVLKIPHHGSRSSSSQPFLDAVSPEWAVISAGRNNVYGFPDPQVLSRLEAAGIRILRIDQEGAVQFQISDSSLKVRTAVSGEIN